VPFMARARWYALLALVVLAAATSLIFVRQRVGRGIAENHASPQSPSSDSASSVDHARPSRGATNVKFPSRRAA
jgi:hypothetical protein